MCSNDQVLFFPSTRSPSTILKVQDRIGPYVDDLKNILKMDEIAGAGLKIGVDPMGGSGLYYWDRIADTYGLNIEVVNKEVDPTFLRQDSTVWTTDKDGIIMNLLAAEIMAVTGKDPAEHYKDLEDLFGSPVYERIDAPANPAQKKALKELSADMIQASTLAGEPIETILTRAPGNNEPIGGLKMVAENGWFAARPSGTEDIYKIYAESFKGREHLKQIQEEAREVVSKAMESAGA